ncbi:hypothetical protein [Paludisphaera sp.]|uniref:hypothetical protein n=1 Tax=Paludisphaera sp. TaxID=2017432 RepID=UPI00301CF010
MSRASLVIGAVWSGDGPPSHDDLERTLRRVIVDHVPGEAWRIDVERCERRAKDPPNLMRVRARGPADAIVPLVHAFEAGGVCDDWHAVD